MDLPPDHGFLLLGNCYGLPEAPQILYNKVKSFMETAGFTQSSTDFCTFFRGSWDKQLAVIS